MACALQLKSMLALQNKNQMQFLVCLTEKKAMELTWITITGFNQDGWALN